MPGTVWPGIQSWVWEGTFPPSLLPQLAFWPGRGHGWMIPFLLLPEPGAGAVTQPCPLPDRHAEEEVGGGGGAKTATLSLPHSLSLFQMLSWAVPGTGVEPAVGSLLPPPEWGAKAITQPQPLTAPHPQLCTPILGSVQHGGKPTVGTLLPPSQLGDRPISTDQGGARAGESAWFLHGKAPAPFL